MYVHSYQVLPVLWLMTINKLSTTCDQSGLIVFVIVLGEFCIWFVVAGTTGFTCIVIDVFLIGCV